MKVKGPTEVNFKQGGGQNFFRSFCSRTYALLSHFQNDGANVECSTLYSKWGRDRGGRSLKQMFVVGPYWSIGKDLTQSCAGSAVSCNQFNVVSFHM